MAANTIADALSRETQALSPSFLEGMNEALDLLAQSRYPTRLRVSGIIWDDYLNRPHLHWSYGTRGLEPLPENALELLQDNNLTGLQAQFGGGSGAVFATAESQMPVPNFHDSIPIIVPGETMLMVETFGLWRPFCLCRRQHNASEFTGGGTSALFANDKHRKYSDLPAPPHTHAVTDTDAVADPNALANYQHQAAMADAAGPTQHLGRRQTPGPTPTPSANTDPRSDA